MKDYSKIASVESIKQAIISLSANGIKAESVKSGEEAKRKTLEMIPIGAEVMTMSSVTLDTIGLSDAINKSDNYISVKNKLFSMDRATQGKEMQKLGAAPEFAVGSVNAVTEDGKIIIASNTGSQLPAYAYASVKVIWVVGAQKIVKNFDEAMERVYQYVLPKESERVKKAYGMAQSFVSKLLIINREINQNRLRLIIVEELLGF